RRGANNVVSASEDCAVLKTEAETLWDDPLNASSEEDGQPPFALSHLSLSGASQSSDIERRYAYAVANPPACIERTISIWVFSGTDASDLPIQIIDHPRDTPPLWYEYEFDDDSDPVLYHRWAKLGSAASSI